MISFTITEKGYNVAPADLKRGLTPVLAMGKVTALLYERFKAGQFPLTVQSMDNCSHNGDKVKSAVMQYAEKWIAEGLVPEEFKAYLLDETLVTFPWAMIDKITPHPHEKVQAIMTFFQYSFADGANQCAILRPILSHFLNGRNMDDLNCLFL